MIKYNSAINILVNRFPDLKLVYESNIDDYRDLPYIFYESVFVKYIIKAASANDENSLCSIFEFVENLLLYGDDLIKNLVEVAIIESIYLEPDFISLNCTFSKYYGILTRKSIEDCIT